MDYQCLSILFDIGFFYEHNVARFKNHLIREISNSVLPPGNLIRARHTICRDSCWQYT